MVSLVVAFTLTPMLAARVLASSGAGEGGQGHGAGPPAPASKAAGFYRRLETAYESALGWCLSHRAICFGVIILIFVAGYYLLTTSRLEFVVDDDMSEFEVVAEAPPGSSVERSALISRAMEEEIRKVPEVITLFTTIGVRGQYQSNVTDISIYVGLQHLSQRRRGQIELMQDVRRRMAGFPGLRVSVQNISLIGGGGFRQTPFNLILRGPELVQLERYAQQVIGVLKTKSGFVDLDTAQALRQPEVQVRSDRQKASDLGVRVDTVAAALRTLVGGEKVGFYRELGEQYDIRLRLEEGYRKDASGLPALVVPGTGGSLVKLSNVTSFGACMSPGQIERYAQERSITIISTRRPSRRPSGAPWRWRQRMRRVAFCTGAANLALANFLSPSSSRCLRIVLAAQFELRAPAHHHGLDVHRHPVRPPHPRLVAIDPEHLLDHGPVPADGRGEEECHSPGGLHQCPARAGHGAHPGPDGGRSRAAAAHPDDHLRHHRGHAAGGAGLRRWLRLARFPRQGGRGRTSALSRRHAPDDAGDLLDVR
jgi:hypothetical protein